MNQYFGDDDLIINASARVPLCICVDTSHSMTHKDGDEVNRFDELLGGLQELLRCIKADERVESSVEICVVGFNDKPTVLHDFATVDSFDISKIKPKLNGSSDLGAGVLYGLGLCDQRKQKYKDNHVDYYRPWLMIMTDGKPWGDKAVENVKKAQKQVRDLEKAEKITVLAVLCGGDKDVRSIEEVKDKDALACLQKFTSNPVQNFSGAGYRNLFRWLSSSISESMGSGKAPTKIDIPKSVVDWTDW
ncbi:MAG: VWA domain-containing protein [Bacilli bacterium]|nr:VWA domain-containing protein [Bacilli bacterium]